MAQTTINIRMDEELKKSFENVCEELGLNMSTAMTIFAKKMSRERQAIRESRAQIQSGNTVFKTMDELEAMEKE